MQDSTGLVIKAATDREELAAVYRLRYDTYLSKGYICEDLSRMKTDEWDELPGTIQFVAMWERQVVGAVRLVLDSSNGLPMEREFAAEVCSLRAKGRKVSEASALVVAPGHCSSNRGVWLKLSRVVWQRAEAERVNDLCIAVTQDHLSFYQRLYFEQIGAGKHYRALNDIFAYPLRLRLERAKTARATPFPIKSLLEKAEVQS